MTFSTEQKITAIKREIGFRKRVYARRQAEGKMTAQLAAEQIGVMEAILADYERLAATNEPSLF
jgi:hypothetical protein